MFPIYPLASHFSFSFSFLISFFFKYNNYCDNFFPILDVFYSNNILPDVLPAYKCTKGHEFINIILE